MLYDSAIKYVKRCRRLRAEGLYVEAGQAAAKAQDILTELTLHLDRRAGDTANLFLENYQAVYALVTKGQIDRSDEDLTAALDLLLGLQDTWQQAMADFRKEFYGH